MFGQGARRRRMRRRSDRAQAGSRPSDRPRRYRTSQAIKGVLNMALDRGDRTYYVSDERLRAFRSLSAEDKLRWVEELATFLRMIRSATETKPQESKASHTGFVSDREMGSS